MKISLLTLKRDQSWALLLSHLNKNKLASPHERFIPLIQTKPVLEKSTGTIMPELFLRFPSTVKRR